MLRPLVFILCAFILLAACEPAPETPPLPTLYIAPTPEPASDKVAMVPRHLEFWQSVSGQLSPDVPVNHWQFTAQAGDDVTLRVLGQGINVQLMTYDSSGTLLGQGTTLELLLPGDGDYLVTVAQTEVNPGTGTYDLGLSYTGQPNPSDVPPTSLPVVVGVPTPVPVSADLGDFIAELTADAAAGELLTVDQNRHVYTWNGVTGQYLMVEMTRASGELQPLLTLYDPDGNVMGLDGGSGGSNTALLRNIRLPENGFYTIQASGRGGGGVYSIQVSVSDQAQPVIPTFVYAPSPTPVLPVLTPTIAEAEIGEHLQDHVPVRSHLATPDDVQRHSFQLGAGELITLSVFPSSESSLIPHIELYDPEGVPVAVVSGNASPVNRQALIPLFTAALAGPYTAFVTAEGQTFGEYQIAYGTGATYTDVQRGEALADQVLQGRIELSGLRDVWYAILRQGDVITADAVLTEGNLNPVLELISESGDLLGIDNNSGGAGHPILNGITIPRTGLYFFRISPTQVNSVGQYSFAWRYVNVAPTATPPQGTSPMLIMLDTVSENTYQFYPFYASGGQQVRITVIAQRETSFDPVAALLDPAGRVIAEGDDSSGGLNPVIDTTIPADGTYTVRVNGYLSSGKFELRVEALISAR